MIALPALKIADTISRFFWQQECLACEKVLFESEQVVCKECEAEFKDVSGERLRNEFDRKFAANKIIMQFIPRYLFEVSAPIQHLIHSLKYRDKKKAGIYLGQKIGEQLHALHIQADIIIPVPLHKSKERERGYNQATVIANGISRITGIPTDAKLLRRNRYTESQTNKTLPERRINMADAFETPKNALLNGKKVLLCDDVITTGATIEECGKILLSAGAQSVIAVSAALAD